MKYYLVDLENVSNKGLAGADFLGGDARIVIFYSASAGKISEFCCGLLARSDAEVIWQAVNVHTKNALDFELAVYAGGLLMSDFTESICIISADSGYKAVTEAGNKLQPGTVWQYSSILEAWYMQSHTADAAGTGPMASIKNVRKMLRQKKLVASIAGKIGLDPKDVMVLMEECGADIHRLYLGMLHSFGKEKGLAVYRQIRANSVGPFSQARKSEKEPERLPVNDGNQGKSEREV